MKKEKKKKILAIACMPFYQEKGSSLRLYSVLKLLASKYEIDLVTYSLGKDINIENLNIYRTSKFFKPKVGVSKPSLSKLLLDKLVFLKAFKLLLFSSKSYEMIHCEDFEAAFLGWILRKVFKKKMVYVLHNRIVDNWEISGKEAPQIVKILEKKVIKSFNLIIANWHMYLKDPVFKGKRIFLHYDSVDIQVEPVKLPFKKYLFYAGNFEKYQGVCEFLNIYKKSKCEIPVILAGEPSKRILDFVKKNELKEKVLLIGRKSVQETNFLIKNSLCCLLPRISGIQPGMKMIHYLMWGKPVIARNLFCNTELIQNNYNGFLYEDNFELEKILKKADDEKNLRILEKGLEQTKKKVFKLIDGERLLREYFLV